MKTKVLLACLALAFAPAVRAADKDDEKAKEVTAAFLKAVKAKDIDALMKTVDVPFFLGPGGPDEPITTIDDLKAKLKAFLDLLSESIPARLEALAVGRS